MQATKRGLTAGGAGAIALTVFEGRDSAPKLLFHVNSTIILDAYETICGEIDLLEGDLFKTKVPNDIYQNKREDE